MSTTAVIDAGEGPPCWNCATPAAFKRCKGCKLAMYCGEQCQQAHWHKGDHQHACAVLGDPYHPRNLNTSDEHHSTLLLAMERGLLEAARDPLIEESFVALGNRIADKLVSDPIVLQVENRHQARAWLEAHELGPDLERALPTEAHVRAHLTAEVAYMQRAMSKIGQSDKGTVAALEHTLAVCQHAEALIGAPVGKLDMNAAYELIGPNQSKRKTTTRKKAAAPRKTVAQKRPQPQQRQRARQSQPTAVKKTTPPHSNQPRQETTTHKSTVTHGSQQTHQGQTTHTQRTTETHKQTHTVQGQPPKHTETHRETQTQHQTPHQGQQPGQHPPAQHRGQQPGQHPPAQHPPSQQHQQQHQPQMQQADVKNRGRQTEQKRLNQQRKEQATKAYKEQQDRHTA